MDKISKETRSKNMSAIKSNNTTPELVIRRILHSLGYRYRLNVKHLPGKPDIVMKKHKTAIFINGCFWHQHENCKYASMPKTNNKFWHDKLNKNVKRDEENVTKLALLGYNVIIIWECEIFNKSTKEIYRDRIIEKISSIGK